MARHLRLGITAIALLASISTLHARQDPGAETVRARRLAYLSDYEAALGSLIASETMHQWPIRQLELGMNVGVMRAERARDQTRIRSLVSEVAFVPLPGNVGWLGYRDVVSVGGRPVRRKGPPLLELLKAQSDDAAQRAGLLLLESARHNLGAPRAINLPSLSLELLHRRHQARFVIETSEPDVVAGCRALRLHLVETARPTIIQRPEGGDMPSRVTAWVEQDTGRLCKAEVRTSDGRLGAGPFIAVVAVGFRRDPAVDLTVPTRMTEQFFIAPRGEGESEATYSNYRRFTTAGRLLPGPD
jgi:hypothetical protein